MACRLRSFMAILYFVTVLASIDAVEPCSLRRASIAATTSCEQRTAPSVRGIRHRGVQALRSAGTLDTRGDARRERAKAAIAIA